jgi:hypothetical protein
MEDRIRGSRQTISPATSLGPQSQVLFKLGNWDFVVFDLEFVGEVVFAEQHEFVSMDFALAEQHPPCDPVACAFAQQHCPDRCDLIEHRHDEVIPV